MAKTFDKTKAKEKAAKQVEEEQIQDLEHLEEKKKKDLIDQNFSRE